MVSGMEFMRMVFHPQATEQTLRSILTPNVEVAHPRPVHPMQVTKSYIVKLDEMACQWVEDMESTANGRDESANAPSPDDLPLSPWDQSALPVSHRAPCPSRRAVEYTEPSPPNLARILQGLWTPSPAHSDSGVPWFPNHLSLGFNVAPLDSIQEHESGCSNHLPVAVDEAHGSTLNLPQDVIPVQSERLTPGKSCRLASLMQMPSVRPSRLQESVKKPSPEASIPTPIPSLEDLKNIASDPPSDSEEGCNSEQGHDGGIEDGNALASTWVRSQADRFNSLQEIETPGSQSTSSIEIDEDLVSGCASSIISYLNTPSSSAESLEYVEAPASVNSSQSIYTSPSSTRFYLELLDIESKAKKEEVQDWMYSLLESPYFATEDALFRSYGVDVEWE